MKKILLKVELHDDRMKQKAMRTVSGIPGVESVSVDMKDNKLTLIGEVDPVDVVRKLKKKFCHTDIVSVGPAKEEKKEAPKKPEEKKPDPKICYDVCGYYYQPVPQYYCVRTVEQDPPGCVIM